MENAVERVAFTVFLTDLVPDACNFQDKAFEGFVRAFMDKFMPAVKMGVFDSDPERWDVPPTHRYEVKERERLGRGGDFFEEEGEVYTCYIIADTDYPGEIYAEEHLEVGSCDGALPDGVTAFWNDKEKAEIRAREMDYEEDHHYGFPWANNWVYFPDERFTKEELEAARFRVGHYTGGDGRFHRVCGIDGGGYSFEGEHWAPLCAIFHETRNLKVETEAGMRFIHTNKK